MIDYDERSNSKQSNLKTYNDMTASSTHKLQLSQSLAETSMTQYQSSSQSNNISEDVNGEIIYMRPTVRGPQIIDNSLYELAESSSTIADPNIKINSEEINHNNRVKSSTSDDAIQIISQISSVITKSSDPNNVKISHVTYICVYVSLVGSVALLIVCKFSFVSDLPDSIESSQKAQQFDSVRCQYQQDVHKQIPFSCIINSFVGQHKRLDRQSLEIADEGGFSSDASNM